MVSQQETAPMDQDAKRKFTADVAAKSNRIIHTEFIDIKVWSDEIRTETDNPDNDDKVKTSKDVPTSIKEKNNNRQKLKTITERVQQTLVAIKIDDGTGNHIEHLPAGASGQVLNTLAGSIDVNDVNERNAIYLSHIIQLGMDNHLTSAQELVDAFQSVKNLEFIDNNLHDKIAETFQTRIISMIGLSPADRERYLNQLITKSQKETEQSASTKTKEELFVLRSKSGDIASNVYGKIEQITDITQPANLNRLNGNRRLKTLATASQAEKDSEKKAILLNVKADLSISFSNVLGGIHAKDKGPTLISDQDLGRQIGNFKKSVNDYFSEGIITEAELTYFYEQVEEYQKVSQQQLNEARKNEGRNLRQLATLYSGTDWLDPELELIDGLDSVENLAELAKKRYNEFGHPDDWKQFTKDIKRLFERLFEIPQAQPNEQWQSAFNQLHEGFFYKEMISKLSGLGEDMKRSSYFKNKKVDVEDIYFEQSQYNLTETPFGPNTRLAKDKLVTLDIGIALQRSVRDEMIKLQEIMEYTHNTNIISRMGLGFDKIAEYSARVSLRDIDRLFHTTEGLSEAYNFYLQNMYQELSLNYHMIPTNFGEESHSTGLDTVADRAYRQLAALKDITKLNDPNLIRLLTMASGIAKGVYGEYWGAAMTARMPLDYLIKYKKSAKGGYEKDKQGRWITDKFELGANYQSVHFPGLEKMLKDVDLDYQLQRFNHPRYWRQSRYAFAPRQYDHHMDEKTKHDFYWLHHADIYKYGEMTDDAFIQGRSKEMAEFDDKFVMWNERMRTSSIDYFLRSAWRFTQYETYFVYQKDENGKIKPDRESGKPKIDFNQTMKKMEGVGPFLVKTFIDDFFDYSGRAQKGQLGETDITGLGLEELAPQVITKYVSNYFSMNEKQKKEAKGKIKRGLYTDYIFERLVDTRPTHFIAMENMRYTPKGEKLLSMRLEEAVSNIFGDKYDQAYIKGVLLPMYIGGIELVENTIWQNKKIDWRTCMDKDEFPSASDPLEYVLSEADFDRAKAKLMNYYQLAQTQAGKQHKGEKIVRIDDENFVENVKKMFIELKKGIGDEHTGMNDNDRTDEFGKGVEQGEAYRNMLVKRYTTLLDKGQGNIGHYLKGNLFDFSEFLFQQAGSRGPERMWGEVAVIATKMNPALKSIIYDVIPELVKVQYPDNHAFEEAVKSQLVKPFKEWCDAIAVIDPDQGLREAKYLVTYLAVIMQKDRNMRYKVIGDAISSFARRTWDTQGSLMADSFWSTARRPTTSLDSDGVEVLTHALLSSVHMPLNENKIVGHNRKNFLGINIDLPIKAKIYEDRNMELVEEVLGVRMRDRLVEDAPMIGPIILIILFLLAKMALDKDKKKG